MFIITDYVVSIKRRGKAVRGNRFPAVFSKNQEKDGYDTNVPTSSVASSAVRTWSGHSFGSEVSTSTTGVPWRTRIRSA